MGGGVLRRPGFCFLNNVIGGSGQVHQKSRRHVASQAFAATVDALVRGDANADVRARLDDGVQIQFLAVRRLLHALVAGRPHLLKAAAHGFGVGRDYAEQSGAVAFFVVEAFLVQAAPTAQVDALGVVPLVVAEAAHAETLVAEGATDGGAFRVRTPFAAVAFGGDDHQLGPRFAQTPVLGFALAGLHPIGAQRQLQDGHLAFRRGQVLVPILQAGFALQQVERRAIFRP